MYKLLDGKKISNEIKLEIKDKIDKLKQNGTNITMADIQVGMDEASNVYISNKIKKFDEVGIIFKKYKFENSITENELLSFIEKLNSDKSINAIFVELPLPNHIDSKKIIDRIDYKKDVDGFSTHNVGALATGLSGFFPCTAEGIIELLKRSNIELEGKNCVILGRSNIVGKPLSLLLLRENATVTICHSKTKNLSSICKNADILIVAINKSKFITNDYVKDGAIVVDVGIHRENINGEQKISGDVNFDDVCNKCSYITPVPGGVGPMTISMLLNHCLNTVKNE